MSGMFSNALANELSFMIPCNSVVTLVGQQSKQQKMQKPTSVVLPCSLKLTC